MIVIATNLIPDVFAGKVFSAIHSVISSDVHQLDSAITNQQVYIRKKPEIWKEKQLS